MELTLEQKEKFFKEKKKIGKVILDTTKKRGLIIFGARATNKQLPPHLRKHTEDYDLFTPNTPHKTARRIERNLDRKFGGNYFEIKEALHPGTHKIINRITNQGIADITKKPKKIKLIKRQGIYYAHTDFQKQKIKEALKDPKSKFRHSKDKETRLRIKLAELQRKKRGKRKTRESVQQRAKKAFRMPKNAFRMPSLRSPI